MVQKFQIKISLLHVCTVIQVQKFKISLQIKDIDT